MRYVIKHPTLGFFTEMQVSETTSILAPMDMVLHAGHPPVKKGDVIGYDNRYEPRFEAFRPSQATQFDTEADAQAQIDKNAVEHGGPEAFAGCTVVPSPSPGE